MVSARASETPGMNVRSEAAPQVLDFAVSGSICTSLIV